jgi:hypothetical protein
MPAIDILNISSNEQTTWTNDLHILFAASGDLRNVIHTVAELPAAYKGKLTICINDMNANVVYRNVLLMLILCSSEDETTAIDTALYVWYSAFLKQDHIDFIQAAHPLQRRPPRLPYWQM